MSFYVYVLRSESTGKTYVGQTSDLQRRLRQHNDPEFRGTLHTKRNKGPWLMIHTEPFPTRAKAMHREKQLKAGSGREWIKKTLLTGDKSDGR